MWAKARLGHMTSAGKVEFPEMLDFRFLLREKLIQRHFVKQGKIARNAVQVTGIREPLLGTATAPFLR
jgi:hypothetical protein